MEKNTNYDMKKDMKKYASSIDQLLEKNSIANIDQIIENHLIKIEFAQHERLIHLIITMAFAIFQISSLVFFAYSSSKLSALLVLLLSVLFFPYVFHYYFLENYVQNMYRQYLKLQEKKTLD